MKGDVRDAADEHQETACSNMPIQVREGYAAPDESRTCEEYGGRYIDQRC